MPEQATAALLVASWWDDQLSGCGTARNATHGTLELRARNVNGRGLRTAREGRCRSMDRTQNTGQDQHVAPLPAGALAPDFALPLTHSIRIALHSLVGHPVVLVFYPLDWEPLSRDQLVLHQTFADEFARHGARVLGISVDSIYCHAAFARDAQIHFPLLADFQPRGGVARQYGVYRDGPGVSARALFVLDRQGRIRFGRAYADFFNPGVDELLTALETLAAEDAAETARPNEVSHGEAN
jgi:peroxiredoxin